MPTATTQVFRLPDLGEGLTEAALVGWLVQVGDVVATDQAIAEVETAKSIVELPSPFAGTVVALHGEPGEVIAVGAPVLEVVAGPAAGDVPAHRSTGVPDASAPAPAAVPRAGEPPVGAGDAAEASSTSVELEAYRAEERAGSGNVLIGYGTGSHGGAVRRRPRAGGQRVGRGAPAASAPLSGRRVAVRSPLVRRLARDLGVDVSGLTGTGSDGAITRTDVLRAADASAGTAPAPTAPSPSAEASASPIDALGSGEPSTGEPLSTGPVVAARHRMSMLRKSVSATLGRSRAEIPEATVWVDVDATDLWNLRPAMAAPGERVPSFTALLARYVLLALAEYPLLAGRIDGSDILKFEGVHLGVAADTERGLMVPVIPRADRLSIAELDRELRSLAEAARAGSLPPERLRGSTFTLNNYGSLGVDGSAAIINHPEVAILGIGRVLERAWVVDGQVVPRRIAQLSLVFDHRVCDGGYAAGFLRRVVDAIEHPLAAYTRI
ncbi:2-oxo acid dehydrogenase subunit E2 [Agromyces sp. CFH 90414]|uniref:Dihydrolipoamide acetyltransferase component of pyruvate dehydrogenase complex n=1 Tax=Agromyces agglutinans TaxID=2662258 RepID=A0A6I2FBJ5_9MICO|nr:dihydrolipoamide acetyltransferase family protein [Agromyces agglutinans]MRG59303.1 2-oxo acid dehydrogenase subunit E2 [Agromyces agglutinans]